MSYPDRVVYQRQVPEDPNSDMVRIVVPVDDAWVLANKSNTLHLTSDKAQIIGDGVDIATITVQLKSPRWIDDSYTNINSAGDVTVLIDDNEVVVSLDANGMGFHQVGSVEAGSFTIRGVTYHSPDPITLEVV